MKKVFCDICGKETEDLKDRICFLYPLENNNFDVFTVNDICWDCRLKIVNFIKQLMEK